MPIEMTEPELDIFEQKMKEEIHWFIYEKKARFNPGIGADFNVSKGRWESQQERRKLKCEGCFVAAVVLHHQPENPTDAYDFFIAAKLLGVDKNWMDDFYFGTAYEGGPDATEGNTRQAFQSAWRLREYGNKLQAKFDDEQKALAFDKLTCETTPVL